MVNRHSSPVVVSERFFASPARVRRLLDEIAEGDGQMRTLYLRPSGVGTTPFLNLSPVGEETGSPALRDWIREVLAAVPESETGAAVFWNDGKAWAVLPPFPIEEDRYADGNDVSGLEEVYERDVTVGVVLLRMGDTPSVSFGARICSLPRLIPVTSRTVTGRAGRRSGGLCEVATD